MLSKNAIAIAKIVVSLRNCVILRAMTQIQQAVERAKKQHGGLRKAAVALGVDPGYLCRLAKGQKSNPAPALLEKLGIERSVTYRKIRA